ncbi:MAG: anhydro-N-acetylmuramic acid kinase [Vulcanimicrobiaceae bacterium]
MIAIGLMSGTSLDGIDAALVHIEPYAESYRLELLDFTTQPFDADLLNDIRAALPPEYGTVASVARLHRRVGVAFARAARRVAGAMRVDYVASHGLTLFHDGADHVTLQVGDVFAIRESLSATVCYDFRSADCALGGHGAPLVPYVDALLLSSPFEDRIALNIGGIANITALGRQIAAHDVLGYDIGPGNMLIDAFVRDRTQGDRQYDEAGAFARAGKLDDALLRSLLEDPYFDRPAPKSAGREEFGTHVLARHGQAFARLSLEDGAATLTALTVESIARAMEAQRLDVPRILASGGGAHNRFLLERLQERLPTMRVETSASVGIDVDAKEAMAFALLGYETLRGRAANVPRITGASRAVPLGSIAPVDLAVLLANVERECRRS